MSGTTKRWLLDTAERTARTPVQGPGRGDAGRDHRSGPDVGREHRDRAARRRIRRAGRLPSRSARTTRPRCCPNTWTRRSRDPSAAGRKVGPRAANDSGPRRARATAAARPRTRPTGRIIGSDTTAEGGELSSRPSTSGRTSSPWTATRACMLPDQPNAWVPPARIGTATRGARRAGKVEPRGMAEGSTRPGSGRPLRAGALRRSGAGCTT